MIIDPIAFDAIGLRSTSKTGTLVISQDAAPLRSIQYLRAIAAIMVVSAHTIGGFGAQGVDIFFVISGFIMMHIMDGKPRGALEFFLSRYFRIAPCYYIATLACLALGFAFEPTWQHITHSFLFLKIKWGQPVLSVGWTLEYEFAFYVCCALSMYFFTTMRARAVTVTVMLLLLTMVMDVILYRQKAYGFFLEFLMGMGVYLLWVRGRLAVVRWPWALVASGVLAIVLLFAAQYWFYSDERLPYRFAGYGIPSMLLVSSALALESRMKPVYVLQLLGDASYSIYLVHVIALQVLYRQTGLARGSSLLTDLMSLVVAVAVGLVFHVCVERPLLRAISAKRISLAIMRSSLIRVFPESWRMRAGTPAPTV